LSILNQSLIQNPSIRNTKIETVLSVWELEFTFNKINWF